MIGQKRIEKMSFCGSYAGSGLPSKPTFFSIPAGASFAASFVTTSQSPCSGVSDVENPHSTLSFGKTFNG